MNGLMKDVYAKIMELREMIYERTAEEPSIVLEVPSPVFHQLVSDLPQSRSQVCLSPEGHAIEVDGNCLIIKATREQTMRHTMGELRSCKLMLEQIARTAVQQLDMKVVPAGRGDRW